MSNPYRTPAGVPTGGQFAAKSRHEANIQLPGQMTIEDCIAEQERDDRRELGRLAGRLEKAAEDGTTDVGRELLPNLSDLQFRSRWNDIVESAATAEKFDSDPEAAHDAPAAEIIVDKDEFVGWEVDRLGEGETRGYDFTAMGESLAEAWRQRTRDAAEDAIKADRAIARENDQREERRRRADHAAAGLPARGALNAALADGMHMSDDPRVSRKFRALERAADAEYASTPAGAVYSAAMSARDHKARAEADERRRGQIEAALRANRERAAEVRAMTAGHARKHPRDMSPEEIVAGLSDRGLRISLAGPLRQQRTRDVAKRIGLIEAELQRRSAE